MSAMQYTTMYEVVHVGKVLRISRYVGATVGFGGNVSLLYICPYTCDAFRLSFISRATKICGGRGDFCSTKALYGVAASLCSS